MGDKLASQVLREVFLEYPEIDEVLKNSKPMWYTEKVITIKDTHDKVIMKYNSNMPISKRISRIKKSANKRGLKWCLTNSEVEKILSEKCIYCGSNLKMGIDRIDSKKGYLIDNVQPCCFTCNIMKNNLTHMDFISHVGDIWNYYLIINKKVPQTVYAMLEYVAWLNKTGQK